MQRHERWMKLGLLQVGVPSLLIGLWIRIDPRSFYEDFPGFGRSWVSALGPYDGHVLTDYGAALVGLSGALIAVALLPRARALPIVLGAWLLAAVPHFLYHFVASGRLSTGDNIVNLTLLGVFAAAPLALLLLDRREQAPGRPRKPRTEATNGDNARIALAPERGLVRRLVYPGSRRELGRDTTPIGVTGHHPTLLAGYSAFEMATMKANRVEHRVKELATLRSAMLVGCEYCVDIGSELSRRSGITDDELRDLGRWRSSERFSEVDRLALEYSEGMTRTPAEIPDALFERLRAHFDEAQLVELTSVIAIENYRARFNWAFGIGADGFSEGAYCVPPDAPLAAMATQS